MSVASDFRARLNAGGQRYRALDAWRGICALLVTITHIPLLHRFQSAGWFTNMQLFVDFFFVLSGFVMCHAYGQQLETKTQVQGFMIRRFGRIYPLHLALLIAFILLELVKFGAGFALKMQFDGAAFTGPRSVTTLISNLFLTQSFNLHGMTSWNGPAWSIGVEFYAYIVFALVVWTVGMRTAAFTALAVIGLAGVAVFAPHWMFTTHDYGFLRCLFGFFTGCLVYQAVTVGRPAWLKGTLPEIVAVAGLLAFLAFTGQNATSMLAPVIFSLVVYVFAFERGAVSNALLSRSAQALGLWSYSIYMVHSLIFAVEKMLFAVLSKVSFLNLTGENASNGKLWTFNNTKIDLVFFLSQIAFTLILSKVTYDWIEDPARKYFARLARNWENRNTEAEVAPISAIAIVPEARMAQVMRHRPF